MNQHKGDIPVKTLFFILSASLAILALGTAEVITPATDTNHPAATSLVGSSETNQPPGSANNPQLHVSEPSHSQLHDVIGTNRPKDGISEPTLTNQPIQNVPLK